jgi:hypothetical protein
VAVDSDDDDVNDSIEVEDINLEVSLDHSPRRPVTPDMNDPDLAPPMSSGSSTGSPVVWPSLSSLAHRTYRSRRAVSKAPKTPEPDAAESDISSPPSLTHSPNHAEARPTAKSKRRGRAASPKVTTADLAALLPRRRAKTRNKTRNPDADSQIISSDEDDDASQSEDGDDELTYSATRTTRARRARALSNAGNNTQKGRTGGKRNSKRTYGSHGSDKENQAEAEEITVATEDYDPDNEEEDSLPEETTQIMLEKMTEELRNAAKKFKEVDKWELAFEEVTEPSSPRDAR